LFEYLLGGEIVRSLSGSTSKMAYFSNKLARIGLIDATEPNDNLTLKLNELSCPK